MDVWCCNVSMVEVEIEDGLLVIGIFVSALACCVVLAGHVIACLGYPLIAVPHRLDLGYTLELLGMYRTVCRGALIERRGRSVGSATIDRLIISSNWSSLAKPSTYTRADARRCLESGSKLCSFSSRIYMTTPGYRFNASSQ
jgi:hypothetical protein